MCMIPVFSNKRVRAMKAVVDLPGTGGGVSTDGGVQNGRVNRRRDIENEEIQMYLSKLKDLVPFMPKNRRLSKLEVIRYVIEYICELQCALETHPSSNGTSDIAARLQGDVISNALTAPGLHPRQPLGTLAPSPNTIINRHSGTSSPTPIAVSTDTTNTLHQMVMSPANSDKSQETDIRPVSC